MFDMEYRKISNNSNNILEFKEEGVNMECETIAIRGYQLNEEEQLKNKERLYKLIDKARKGKLSWDEMNDVEYSNDCKRIGMIDMDEFSDNEDMVLILDSGEEIVFSLEENEN